MIARLLPGRRMAQDTAWNFVALGATASAGAAVVLLIAARMAPEALGVFAQLYAVHIIGAQAAVLGVHDSTQKHAAEYGAKDLGDATIVSSAVLLAAISALLVAGLIAAASPLITSLIRSEAVGRGLLVAAPGIVAFAVNKVLFAALNGRTRLQAYAAMQVLRAVFVLAAALVIAGMRLPTFMVGAIFTAAELALLPCLLLAVRPSRGADDLAAWIRRHLTFGGRGVVNAILLEAHLRVDVLTLSVLMDDRSIGVYAFAMLFAEAVYQVPVVIRTVAYPTLVRLAAAGDRGLLAGAVRRVSAAGGATALAGAAVVLIGYPLVAAWFAPAFLAEGVRVLHILLAGMVLYAFFVPFDQLLLQSGMPGRQSLLMAAYVAINIVLNVLLIPRFGIAGAAIATSLALAAAAAALLAATSGWLGFRGTILFHRARTA